MNERLLIFEKAEGLQLTAIETWRAISLASIRDRGCFTAALSGGRTPEPFYRRLAGSPDLPWGETHLFMVDERMVPSDHPDSNARMVRETLIDRSALPSGNFHPIPTDPPSPHFAADAYEFAMRTFFRLPAGAGRIDFPSFDLIVLGIGEDGHTASLFPGGQALSERRRIAAPVFTENPDKHDRVTLTLPVLNRAKNAIFLLTGRKKASILKRILQKDISLPASLVHPETGNLFILADAEAGSEVRSEVLNS